MAPLCVAILAPASTFINSRIHVELKLKMLGMKDHVNRL